MDARELTNKELERESIKGKLECDILDIIREASPGLTIFDVLSVLSTLSIKIISKNKEKYERKNIV
jgi:hypothetical protein